MATDRNLYSAFIGWAKIVLPLSALALLSTLFLFARQSGEQPAIPVAELDKIAREQQISAPRFSGVANDGSVIAITATTAKPEGQNDLTIVGPLLSLNASDGTRLTIRAGRGALDNTKRQATLDGLAQLETSSGYMMETKGLVADLATGVVTSLGPLEIQAPYGRLTAGSVTIATARDGTGQRMDFTDGVKLLYTPSKSSE